jgi:hypothetical protein
MNLLKVPGRSSKATVELVFEATDLPPLGFKSFLIVKDISDTFGGLQAMTLMTAPKGIRSISNEVCSGHI